MKTENLKTAAQNAWRKCADFAGEAFDFALCFYTAVAVAAFTYDLLIFFWGAK